MLIIPRSKNSKQLGLIEDASQVLGIEHKAFTDVLDAFVGYLLDVSALDTAVFMFELVQ